MLKKTIFLLSLFLVSFSVISQEKVEQLTASLEGCNTDTCKINRLHDIAEYYEEINPELMFKYQHQASKLLSKLPKYLTGQRRSLEILSKYHYSSGDFEKTLETYELMQVLNYSLQDTLEVIRTLTNQSTVLETLGQYNKAIANSYTALELCDEIGHLEGAADTYNNLAILSYRQGEFQKSLEHFNEALAVRKNTNKPHELAAVYNNLGLVHFALENQAEAMIHFKKAIEILQADGYEEQLASGYINLGGLLTEQHKYAEALTYYNKALVVMEQTNDLIGIANAKISIGEHYLKKGTNYEAGIVNSLEGLEAAKQVNYFAGQKAGLDILKNLYEEQGDYKNSLKMYEQYVALQDSLNLISYETNIAGLEQKYQVAKTERENLELLSVNDQIAKNLRKFVLWGTIISLLLVGIIVGVGLFFRQRELKYKLLAFELEQKALRAQMNPHFIFNALVSIQSCILDGDRMIAYTYQSKFAKLLRSILQNSEEKTIPLEKELKSLQLYIELEQFRVENKFDYSLIVEDESIHFQPAPSMIFQPFVENAIWHGLLQKPEGRGMLTVRLSRDRNRIKCMIDDNGIGRDQAAINNSTKRDPNHKSMGIAVTKGRLDIYNRENHSKADVTYIDKMEDGIAVGTTVVFYLPYKA